MSNIQTGAERMPHDLSHLGFLAGQIGRLIDRKSGSAGMPRPISYAVFCLKKKNQNHPELLAQADPTLPQAASALARIADHQGPTTSRYPPRAQRRANLHV